METIHIVAATDKGFVMPTGVMMYSVCVNNPKTELVFHVMVDEGVTQQDKADLKKSTESTSRLAKVLFYEIDSGACKNLPTPTGLITVTTYFRFFLTDLLPDDIEKVLYLDGDLIVRHSLVPLWETDLGEYAVAVVPDSQEATIEWYNRLRFPPSLGYFNAGVMLINLKYWRTSQLSKELLDIALKRSEDLKLVDQDVLNIVLKGEKKTLPIKYNLQRGFLLRIPRFDYWKYEGELKEALEDPVIVHYTNLKPWYTPLSNYPFNSTFLKYQDQTIWKGQRVRIRSKEGNVIRRVLTFCGILKPKRGNKFIDIAPID